MTTEKEIKDWYNQWHCRKGEDAWRSYEAYHIMLDYLKPQKGKRLLDLGCGTGYLLKGADERGLETYGIDISDEAVKIAKRISPNSKIIEGRGEKINFPDNFFDYLICIGALEHFIDMEKGIDEIIRVAQEDALFCIVVPNVNYLYWKIRGKKGTKQSKINERLLSLDDWKNTFNQKGLKILKVYPDKWPFQKISIFSSINPLAITTKAICKLVAFTLPLKYTYQFVFIMRKKESKPY